MANLIFGMLYICIGIGGGWAIAGLAVMSIFEGTANGVLTGIMLLVVAVFASEAFIRLGKSVVRKGLYEPD